MSVSVCCCCLLCCHFSPDHGLVLPVTGVAGAPESTVDQAAEEEEAAVEEAQGEGAEQGAEGAAAGEEVDTHHQEIGRASCRERVSSPV